jgi:phosphoglycolate phosphatase-like HAD superfamily hydrolase
VSECRVIFFDMHGVLMDERTLFPQYARAWAQLLAARFGEGKDTWLAAYGQMMREWQRTERSLNLRASDGVAQLEQAWRRVAGKGLEQAGVKSSGEELAWMVEELPWEAGMACSAAFPEVTEALEELKEVDCQLAVASLAMSSYSRGLLVGTGIDQHFSWVFGPDNVGLAHKCPQYYRRAAKIAGLELAQSVIVDDNLDGIAAAVDLGALAVLIDRGKSPGELPGRDRAREAADLILPDLEGLARELQSSLPLERRA